MSRTRVANPRSHRLTDREDATPHSVYRIYDANDTLLYVGVARDVTHRLYMHETAWYSTWPSMQMVGKIARHTAVEYPTKLAARAAEREAITTEAPLYNRQHNSRRWVRRAGEWVERAPDTP